MCSFVSASDAIMWCMEVQRALVAAEWSEQFNQLPASQTETVDSPDTHQPVIIFNGIRVRMGIHAGPANARRNPVTGRMDYFGPTVNRAARVSDSAHGGQIVCTQEVMDLLLADVESSDSRFHGANRPLTKHHGLHTLKGINDQVAIFEIIPADLRLRTFPPIRTSSNEA